MNKKQFYKIVGYVIRIFTIGLFCQIIKEMSK
jgi:hypothetical protein